MTSTREDYEFDAWTFARSWLAVATAASEDDERPILHRTVAIEIWPNGVRLTATDSYLLWSSWVPRVGFHAHPEPALEELPDEVIVAHDGDFRGRDLLKFAFKVVTGKDASPQNLKVTLGPAPLEDGQFPGTESEAVSFSFPADVAVGERVVLGTIEGRYPEWRGLLNHGSKNVKEVALGADLLGRVGSIKRWWPSPLKFTFTGHLSVVHLAPLADPAGGSLIGGVMPVRIEDAA